MKAKEVRKHNNELEAVARRIGLWSLDLEDGKVVQVHKEIESIAKRLQALTIKSKKRKKNAEK